MDFSCMTIEERDELLRCIADMEFLPDNVSSEFKCQNCDLILVHHYMPPCQHPYCSSCYEQYKEKSCKTCNDIICDFKQDCEFDKKLLSLKIPCSYQENGCEELVAVEEFLKHLDNCQYSLDATLPQPWKPPSLEEANIKQIQENSEKIDQITNELESIKQNYHQNDAQLNQVITDVTSLTDIVRTTQDAMEKILKELASLRAWKKSKDEHDNELQESMKQNSDQIGSKISIIAQQVQNTEENLGIFSNHLIEVTEKLGREIQTITNLRELAPVYQIAAESNDVVKSILTQRSTNFIWKINNFKHQLQQLQQKKVEVLTSDAFLITEHGYEMQAKLLCEYSTGFISLRVGFSKKDASLPPIYYHRRTYIIVDQSYSTEKMDMVVVEEPGFGNGEAMRWMNGYLGPFNFPPIDVIKKNDTYTKNDCLIIKILIEPLAILYKICSNTLGVLVWKIDNYTQRKKQQVEGVVQCLRSDYFYSSNGGYRMQTLLYLNGIRRENKNKHLSVCHCFPHGEWDDSLPSKFPHKTTCSILDPNDPHLGKHLLSKYKEKNTTFWDCFDDFASQKEIETSTYIKNDTLYLHVAVESQ